MLDVAAARALLARSRPDRNPDGYPVEVRAEVTELARGLVAGGQTFASVARQLGLHRETVSRWVRGEDGAEAGFVPVEVTPPRSDAGLAVVSPAGYRLEGLGFEEALVALSRLG